MTSSLNISLSLDEILFAAILGLIITWIVQNVVKLKGFMKNISVDFGYNADDLNKILDKCYSMFPIESVLFKGETFSRGNKVRVTTLQNKSFEGEFIGLNSKNMVCILTKKYIVAYEINNIDNIIALEK